MIVRLEDLLRLLTGVLVGPAGQGPREIRRLRRHPHLGHELGPSACGDMRLHHELMKMSCQAAKKNKTSTDDYIYKSVHIHIHGCACIDLLNNKQTSK